MVALCPPRYAITNSKLREISGLDTLKASKMLRAWVDCGLLEPLLGRVRSNAGYRRPIAGRRTTGAVAGT